MNIRVVVADDSILFRRVLTDALTSLPGIEVVGTAPNGKIALQRVRDLKPDILTLDIEMPEIDGLGVLDALRASGEKVEVIVVSALTRRGGELTLKALEKGAFDFITKPEATTPEKGKELVIKELGPRLKALAHRLEIRSILHDKSSVRPAAPPVEKTPPPVKPAPSELADISGRMNRLSGSKPVMALIGVSTGGPNALAVMLPRIPADLGVPVLIVQHMPPVFTQSLAESLAAKCAIDVKEAVDGEEAKPNIAYIAPGGKQMRVVAGFSGAPTLQITDDPPENNCKPSVDYLFRSASNNFPGRSMAVILTGMGSDGTLGLRLLKRHGCYVVAQDEASCVVYGMPKAAVDAGVVDSVLPLDSVASQIVAAVRGVAK